MPPSPKQLADMEERRDKVEAMMLARLRPTTIARQLGITRQTTYTDMQAVRGRWREKREHTGDRRLDEEIARLNALEKALWPAAMDGKWLAIDRCLKIHELRVALNGDQAPQRMVVSVITPQVLAEFMLQQGTEIAQLQQRAIAAGIELPALPVIPAEVIPG